MKVEESLYDEVCEKIIETFEASKKSRSPVHNAIKISGLMDFDLLKKVNLMHQKIEDVFELALEETEKDILGKYLDGGSNFDNKGKGQVQFY